MKSVIHPLETITDELREIGCKRMAEELEVVYNSPEYVNIDRLDMLQRIIEPEYNEHCGKRYMSHIQLGHLKGCPEELSKCIDTAKRQYLPEGTIRHLSTMQFVKNGMNVCILGASNSGKTYLAKAIGLEACSLCRVEYYCTEELIDSLMALKRESQTEGKDRFTSRKKHLCSIELLILDDFLLHSVSNETEIKVIHEIFNKRVEAHKSTIVCSQRLPQDWKAQIMNDEIAADAIMKRATRHYTVMINLAEASK